jgi:uncharacterized repeat protein (TIGR03803 family)
MQVSPAAALVLACSGTILAQNYAVSVPHQFEGEEGRDPVDLIQASDGSFIGVAAQGGLGYGTVFQLKANERITRVHLFRGADGAIPNKLIQAKDGTLYGTTAQGGNTACSGGCGTVFHIDAQGNFSTLYAFSGPDGQSPAHLLQAQDGNLYGTTGETPGGPTGAVFKLTPAGAFSEFYTFCSQPSCTDGAWPSSLIRLPDGDLAGLTLGGGRANGGVVFRLTLTGVESVLLAIYSYEMGSTPRHLVLAGDGTLYFTVDGDPYGSGRVLHLAQGHVKVIHQFDYTDGDPPYVLERGRDGNIYGVSASGGTNFLGTVFEVSVATGFRFLYNFTGSYEGATPTSVLLGSDGNLYGTTGGGGVPSGSCVNCGIIFELQKLGPQAPALTSFVPNSSPVGAQVTINGANLTGTTKVQFGRKDAEFKVLSDTQIDAQVPSGAGAGPIIVTTPDGDALSIPPFETGPTLTTLYDFCPSSPFPYCPDGVNVNSLIRGVDGNLYGTTNWSVPNSTVFRVTTAGTLTTLATDMSYPNQLFQASNGTLFGTSQQGGDFNSPTVCNPDPEGASGCGVLFKFAPNGAFTQLYAFRALKDGGYPLAGVVEGSDGALYGTTSTAGANGQGTIYRWSDAGLETLYSFGGADGSSPTILVAAKDTTFYGITTSGGLDGKGTVFTLDAGGSVTTLYSFTGKADGGAPSSLILMPDGNLYGATSSGGAAGGGTVFQMTTAGSLVTLYNFSGSIFGGSPANLVAGDDRIFGTTGGGPFGGGTIFEMTLTGDLQTLYAFFASSTSSFGGYEPTGLAHAPDGSLYGVTAAGGALSCQYGQGCGTVFHLVP